MRLVQKYPTTTIGKNKYKQEKEIPLLVILGTSVKLRTLEPVSVPGAL